MVTRRNFLVGAGTGVLAQALVGARPALAADPHHGHAQHGPGHELGQGHEPVRAETGHTPVHTPNGWTLPHRMVDGVKEFHLVAEEIEHEFAPGCSARCWGYNGSTPGPTIEAVEGDRVRIYVTNRLGEPTSVHWHGFKLPSGMDGVGGLTQPHIKPGETFAYEFILKQHGTQMYHPHVDEMVQMAMGMMGMFIIHPRDAGTAPVDRDYVILLHNWALHPGTYRPDPSVMVDFDLWTMNSKVFPATAPLVARTGERIRIRIGNLSMWNHPMHLHGVHFLVTGGDGGRWPENLWRSEATEIVGVGQTRDIEFIAVPGDWAFHCHMAHHTMNPMAHEIANTIGVDQSGIEERIRKILPGYMAMGKHGMAEHQAHTDAGHMPGPENTLPMFMGRGPFGEMAMGGMLTVVKVRDDLRPDEYGDPGWFEHPPGSVARKVSSDPSFGAPVRKEGAGQPTRRTPTHELHGHEHHEGGN